MMFAPVVLVPLNDLSRAKGRLAGLFGPEDRAAIAGATLQQVVSAATAAGLRVVVLAARRGDVALEVDVVEERSDVSGLNAQLETAVESLGVPEVLILHADLPLATAGDLRRLIDSAPPPPSVTLVRSSDGGTNAMVMRPSGCISLHYGPASFEKHLAAAREAGVAVCPVGSEKLELDLDTPGDVDAFLRHPDAPTTTSYRMISRLLGERA